MTSRNYGRLALLIVAAGFVYRLAFVWARQLETDELMQALVARSHTAAEMLDRLRGGIILAAPLDYLIQKGFVALLGESTWVLRMHAVIFGALSIWFFYHIAQLLFTRKVAIYSTLLFAVFPLQYHYSQEGRPYALFVFLTLLSYDLLFRIAVGLSKGRLAWTGLLCVLTLLLYSSFLGVLVILSQFAALIAQIRFGGKIGSSRERSTDVPQQFSSVNGTFVSLYVYVAIVSCLLFLPWARFIWHKPEVADAAEILNFRLILRIIKELGDGSYVASALIFVGVGAGIAAMVRHGQHRSLRWLLFWSCLTLPVLLSVEIWSGYYFAIRDILHATPPLFLIAGYGLSYLGEQMTILDAPPYKASAPSVGYAVVFIVTSVLIAQGHWRDEPVDWKGTAEFLYAAVKPGDELTMAKAAPLLEYYAPVLVKFSSDDLDPGPGRLASGAAGRRLVVCLDRMPRDPCAAFKKVAAQLPAWHKYQRRGFTLFMRER